MSTSPVTPAANLFKTDRKGVPKFFIVAISTLFFGITNVCTYALVRERAVEETKEKYENLQCPVDNDAGQVEYCLDDETDEDRDEEKENC